MQQFTWTVLDDLVVAEKDTIVVLTPGQYDEGLGSVDQLLIELSVDHLYGHNMTADLQIEHSGDAIHWLPRSHKPEIDGAKIESTTKNNLPFVFEDGVHPTLAFVRIRVTLRQDSPAPLYPFRARVVLVVTGNDYNEAAFRAAIDKEREDALDNAELEQGVKMCGQKFGPGAALPTQVGSLAAAETPSYIDYDSSKKVYSVKPPFTLCVSSDGLTMTVMRGTTIVDQPTVGT